MAARPALAVAGLTAVALALRLAGLHQSLAGDELFTYAAVVDRPLDEVVSAVKEGGENSPPFFFLLAWLAAKLGDPSVTIRLPSVVLGTATIPLLYLLGERTVGRRAGLVAATLLALSPFALFYSVEARSYATLIFLVVLSSFALVRAVEGAPARWWIVYGLASCGVLYTHYFGVFVLLAQAAWALWARRDRAVPLLGVNVAVVLAYIPWLPSFFGQKGDEIDILAFYKPLNTGTVWRESLRLFPGHPEVPWNDLPGRPATFALIAAVCVALVVGLREVVRRRDAGGRPWSRSPVGLAVAVTLASPVGFVAYSALGPETFIARYLSPSLPGLLLLIGLVLTSPRRAVSVAATTVAVAVVAVGSARALQQANERPDYRGAAGFIEQRLEPDDMVVDRSITLGASGERLRRGGRRTSLAVHLGHDEQIVPGPALLSVLRRTAPGSKLFVVGPRVGPGTEPGLPLRLRERHDFAGTVPLRVAVYVRTAAPVPRERAATRAERRAPAVSRCLREQGLVSSPRGDSAPGVAALDVELSGGVKAVVVIHNSVAEARAALSPLRAFLRRAGGEARLDGTVIVGFTGAPDGAVAALVRGCA